MRRRDCYIVPLQVAARGRGSSQVPPHGGARNEAVSVPETQLRLRLACQIPLHSKQVAVTKDVARSRKRRAEC